MAGRSADAMPLLPPDGASHLPADVARSDLVWSETIAPNGYGWRTLSRGTRLSITDVDGDACTSILLFNAVMPTERLNVADTMKVQWSAYIGTGKLLLSDMGRVMASILSDEAETHDCVCGPSTPASLLRRRALQGSEGQETSARERLLVAVAKLGLGRKDVHPCVNLFKGVRILADGTTELEAGPCRPARTITLRAEMDLMIALANCRHVLDVRESNVTPIRILAWRGRATAEDDEIRCATPESLRAFLNTEDYYRR
jgi:urea carboxylase-associated protein 2